MKIRPFKNLDLIPTIMGGLTITGLVILAFSIGPTLDKLYVKDAMNHCFVVEQEDTTSRIYRGSGIYRKAVINVYRCKDGQHYRVLEELDL